MYVPGYSKLENPEAICEIIAKNSFATLVVSDSREFQVVHIPIVIASKEPLVLAGHVAKANPIWKLFDGDSHALAIFMGSHGYVSPSMYLSRPNVPTWNYATVHAKGTLEIVEDSVAVVEHLRDMIHFFDPTLIDTHPEALEWDYVERISKGVVVFKMAVSTLEAKHKMNQNKSQEDRTSVISCLVETQEPDQQALASWMQHWADPNPSGP